MALNPNKTKCMIISSKGKIKQAGDLKLSIGEHIIENVTVQKVLGVYVDNTLSWNVQISKVCSKLNSKIALLKRTIFYLSDEMKLMFYNGYIMPDFDYCCTIWGKNIRSNGALTKISKIQKRAARIILNSSVSRNLCTNCLLNKLQWLSFENRCRYHTGVLVYKAKFNQAPKYLSDLIILTQNENYSLRSMTQEHLALPRPRTNYLKDTFGYKGASEWNSIPHDIRQSKSINSFKRSLKDYLCCIQLKSFCHCEINNIIKKTIELRAYLT